MLTGERVAAGVSRVSSGANRASLDSVMGAMGAMGVMDTRNLVIAITGRRGGPKRWVPQVLMMMFITTQR